MQKVVASRVLQRLPAPQQPGASLPRSSSTSNSSSSSSSSRRFSNATAPRAALWSRQPDELDQQWEQEEAARRQQRQQLTLAQQAAEEAAWRQQVDQVHQQLLDQQKHKAALRQRLQQDAQRAKREQLRRIEPVAKARARASGLASLGLDPEIMALSEKFGRLSGLVDEVQQRMEAQYGLYGSDWDASLGGQLPPSPATNRQQGPSRLAAGQQQLQQPMQQAPPQMGARAWPQQPRLRSQQLPQQQQQPQQQQPALQRLPQTGPGARTQQRPQQQQQVPSLQQPPVTQQQAQGGMPLRPASFQGAVPAQPQHQSAWQSSSSQPWQQPVAPPQQHEPATGHRAPV